MSADERIVVLGGEQPPPEAPVRSHHRMSVLVAVGLVTALVVTFIGSSETPVTSVDPGDLTAPPDPPSAYVVETTTTLPAEISPLAVGWRAVVLAGSTGWGASAVAHGPDGWLAVSEGAGVVAHTSDNGVLWQAVTIADLAGHQARAAVGEGVLAVAMSSVAHEGAPQAAISVDGGSHWAVEALDRRRASIDDVAVIGGTVHVFGSVGSNGTPVVWRRDVEGWMTVEDASRSGYVGAVAEAPDGGVRAFGLADGSVAAWSLEADSLEPVDLDLPTPWTSILEVVPEGTGGYVGLAVAGDESQGRAVVTSTDLVTWTEVAVAEPITSLTPIERGSYLAVSGSGDELWALEGGRQKTLPRRLPDLDTGRQAFSSVSELATDGNLLVAVGSGPDGEPLLAVRSSVSRPLSVPRPSDFAWRAVAEEVVTGGPGATLAAQGGGLMAVRADSRGLLVSGLEAGEPELEEWVAAGVIGGWPGGVWAWSDGRLRVDSAIESDTLAVHGIVEAVGEIDGRVTVVMRTELGAVQLETHSGEEWVSLGGPVADLGAVVPIATGFVADSFSAGARSTLITLDGVTWTSIEGTLRGGNGVPFVAAAGDGRQVQLLDRWPAVQEVELPTAEAYGVVRHGHGFFVLSPGSVWVGDPANGWVRIPAGVENGVPGHPVLLAGDVPTLVTVAGDRLLLLRP